MEKRTLQPESCAEPVGKSRTSPNPNHTSRNIKCNRFRRLFASVIVSVGIPLFPLNARAGPIHTAPPIPMPPAMESPRPAPVEFRLPPAPRMEYEGGAFGLENSPEGLSLVYEKGGIRRGVPLALPPAEILGDIKSIYYGEGWSAILTHNPGTGERYAIVTLGAADVAAGRETLPGNEFLNADCILIPGTPISDSFAEDRLFLFYGEGLVRVLDGERMRRLTVEGASEDSKPVKYMGLYFLMQPNGTPVITLKEGSPCEAQAFDYDSSGLRSLQDYSIGSSGLSVRFLNSEGQRVEILVTVGEEGNLETVHVEVR